MKGLFESPRNCAAQRCPPSLCARPSTTCDQRISLQRLLDDGRLEADSNTAENAIRPLAVGRKNWLFAGSERGGRTAALYLGLSQSCKACDVSPWAYFGDILRRLMSHAAKRLRELLPEQWRPAQRDARA